jgi:hypothetical protein
MPPNTEKTLAIHAFLQAEFGLASPIEMSITSGGIGKKEDSINAITPRIKGAR